jgi:hypothetical protein
MSGREHWYLNPMTRQQISKQVCARYAKLRGDEPQQHFRLGLNIFIMAGLSVPEAEAQALALVRKDHPGFTPVRAAA